MTERARRLAASTITVALLVSSPAIVAEEQETPAAAAETADPWALLRQLEGSWTGAIDGKLGAGTGVRQQEFILGGRHLMCRHESVRLPQERSPKGDQHQELEITNR